MPHLSVILPAHNAEKYISEAIQSILSQNFADFELIVIDDGSTDGTAEEINSFNDTRIKCVTHSKQEGIVECLNEGLALAKGAYIARMDADDVSHSERFAKQVGFMDAHPEVALCGTRVVEYDSGKFYEYDTENELLKTDLLFFNPFCHPSVVMRKSVLDGHRLTYSTAYPHAEDYELWTRIAKFARVANLPEILLRYRVHEGQISIKKRGEQIHSMQAIAIRHVENIYGALNDEDKTMMDMITKSVYGIKPSERFYPSIRSFFERLLEANKKAAYVPDELLFKALDRFMKVMIM